MKLLLLFRSILILLASLALIFLAVQFAKTSIKNRPKPPKAQPRIIIPEVSFMDSSPKTVPFKLETDGLVSPFWQTEIAAQVGGEVIAIADGFQTGLKINKGDTLLEIESTVYEGAVAQKKAAIAMAQQQVAEEEAKAAQALRDWERSGRAASEAPPLTLRKPQLAAVKGNLESAQISLRLAELDLSRCKIIAPFDGMVQARSVSLGNVVSPGVSLGQILGTERLQVRLAISPKQARRLQLPFGGEAAEPINIDVSPVGAPGLSWPAVITRTETEIDRNSRLFYVFADIFDPFKNPEQPLPIGAYVTATIPGIDVEKVHEIPESSLINDRKVWVLDESDTLRSHPVERAFSQGKTAYVRFSNEPDASHRIVLKPLPSFRSGMQVRLVEPEGPEA